VNGLDCTISANITPTAAVRLLIMNEIAIDGFWQTKQAENLLNELDNTTVTSLLRIIDFIEPQNQVDSVTLPQFGSLETLVRVPEIMISTGMDGLSYTQLGFYLKGDVNAKQSANAKYGETHGKGACQLGFAGCQKSKIHFGSLTNAFHEIPDHDRKLRLAKLIYIEYNSRQIVAEYLYSARKQERSNHYEPPQRYDKRRIAAARADPASAVRRLSGRGSAAGYVPW
jgi:hypothetical protein